MKMPFFLSHSQSHSPLFSLNWKFRAILPLWTIVLFLFISCAKDEGYGGNSSIEGVIIGQRVNPVSGFVLASFPLPEERLYIVFGDEAFYGDDSRTHYNGHYRFDNLRKGDYTIYGYEYCSTCDSGIKEKILQVNIPDNKSEVVADTLFLIQE